jgi:predicted XRE-type DNA-binding protein
LEQIAKLRTKDSRKAGKGHQEDVAKALRVRTKEQMEAVNIFLANTDYSDHKIADLVGVTVSFVEKVKEYV